MTTAFEAVQVIDCGQSVGRGLVATKQIKKGDTIFTEDPLVLCQFSWNRKYGYLACDHCMTPLESSQENIRRLCQQPDLILPFSDNSFSSAEFSSSFHAGIISCHACPVKYCSPICQDNAWKSYHATLCLREHANNELHPLNQLDEAWRSIHYPPESGSIMLLCRMVAMVKQASEADKHIIISKFASFCQSTTGESDTLAHKLLGEKFVSEIENIRELFTAALYDASVSEWFSFKGFRELLALVGRNSQGVATSPLSAWVSKTSLLPIDESQREALDTFIDQIYSRMDDTVGQFLDNEGVGLYCVQSLANHSCEPTAEVKFSGVSSCLSMVALEDLTPGLPVTISYLTECDLNRSRHSRSRWLAENYLFTCQCIRCLRESDQASVTSEEEEDDDAVEPIDAD